MNEMEKLKNENDFLKLILFCLLCSVFIVCWLAFDHDPYNFGKLYDVNETMCVCAPGWFGEYCDKIIE